MEYFYLNTVDPFFPASILVPKG